MPPSLSFPPTELNIKETGKTYKVLCLIRKKWLVLTPEEWVRQHVIGYLIKKLGISSGRIAVEKSFYTTNERNDGTSSRLTFLANPNY